MKLGGSYPRGRLGLISSCIFSRFLKYDGGVDDLLTPLPEALAELEIRRRDPVLKKKIQDYIGDNVPSYFKGAPVLYLARHLATPNFETVRFSHLLQTYDLPVIIGQDTRDKFVPQNILKWSLCRLPVYIGTSHKDGQLLERFQKMTIVDFNTASGKPFSEIHTLWGQKLVDFHAELCARYLDQRVQIEDDAAWIDKNRRGDLLGHYKNFLTLFVMHGILFEDFLSENSEERRFVETVLRPAFSHVEKVFGVRPLITHLQPTSIESELFWMAYPAGVLDIIKEKMASKIS